MLIRCERPSDRDAIASVIAAAFADHRHSNRKEHVLVNAPRDDMALSVSLIAEDEGEVVGHVAFSRVQIGGTFQGWYGPAPLAVRPDRQRRGIGQALVNAGLERLGGLGAEGCVVLGEPDYYVRFGFRVEPGVWLPGVPPEYFLILPFVPSCPTGRVAYHPAFSALV